MFNKLKKIIKQAVGRILFHLYRINIKLSRKIVLICVRKMEGGDLYSSTLRQIYAFYHKIQIGMFSYGGCFSLEHVPAGTTFGRFCSIASNVSILNGNHPLNAKSLHPFFYNPVLGYVDKLLIKRTKLTIENDVWIGKNVTILPSVSKIDNGAAIGAGSVVTKNVPAFAVIAGNPAKIIRYRFSEDKIKEIIDSAWWNKDLDDLKANFASFIVPYEDTSAILYSQKKK